MFFAVDPSGTLEELFRLLEQPSTASTRALAPSLLAFVLELLVVATAAFALRQHAARSRRLDNELRHARQAVDRYTRALSDYEQIVRHRVMNPLMVIEGAAHTLRAGIVTDHETCEQLLTAIVESSQRLKHVTLEPEVQRVEEAKLRAAIHPSRPRPLRPAHQVDRAVRSLAQ